MTGFDQHLPCAHCCDKGQGSDPCVMQPDCSFCNILTLNSDNRLSHHLTILKKEKKDSKADKKDTSGESSTLIDPGQVSVLGAVNVKFPEQAVVKENRNQRSQLLSRLLVSTRS